MKNSVFGKTLENVRKHKDNKVITNEARRNCLVSKPNYHITNIFSELVLAIEMKQKTQMMHEFWYNYVKPNYGEKKNKRKICYMDTDSFIA